MKSISENFRKTLWDAAQAVFCNALLVCLVFTGTQHCVAQETTASKIPEGEAHFTQEQLEEYYRVYENADVRYLRKIFDSCMSKSGGTPEECALLGAWSKDYLKSKFIVMSRDGNPFGGTLVTILFQDRADKVFVAWVYPAGAKRSLRLRELSPGEFSEEDIRRIKVRYRTLIEDKKHAM